MLWFYSNHLHTCPQVNWHPVFWGIATQYILALIILRWEFGYRMFEYLGNRTQEFLAYSDQGAEFMFGPDFRDHFFGFAVSDWFLFSLLHCTSCFVDDVVVLRLKSREKLFFLFAIILIVGKWGQIKKKIWLSKNKTILLHEYLVKNKHPVLQCSSVLFKQLAFNRKISAFFGFNYLR